MVSKKIATSMLRSQLRTTLENFPHTRCDSNPNRTCQPPTASCVKLPKIDLPTFTGKLTEWIPFYDLFAAAVDSQASLTNAQKLQYLKASVKNEPSQLISSLTIADGNYQTALTILKQRYDNKRVIIREHIHAIFSFAPIRTETASLMRRLIETVDKSLMSLQNLEIDVSSWDPMIVYLICERLDSETRKQWELTCASSTLPSYADLRTFIESRSCALEASHTSTRFDNSFRRADKKLQSNVASSEQSCPCCKGTHRIYTCPKFAALAMKDRQAFASFRTALLQLSVLESQQWQLWKHCYVQTLSEKAPLASAQNSRCWRLQSARSAASCCNL